MRIPNSVLAFAQDKIDIYKAFADYFNHYRSMNGKEGLEYDKAVSFSEKEDKMNKALKSEICRASNISNFEQFAPEVWVTNPMHKWATFAVVGAMVDTVLPQTVIDSIGTYTDVVVGGYSDSFSFNIKPRDLFVVSKAGRGKRNSEVHKQFDGQVTVIPVEHDITVQVSLYRVLCGQESLAEFAMKAIQSLETAMTIDAYNTFATAMNALPTTPSGGALKVTGFDQTTAVQLAQNVTKWNGGAKAVFAGTQLALQNILPSDANYRYTLDSDYVKIGYVKTFAGYDCLVFPQVADYSNPFASVLDDTKIHVISPSAQKLIKQCIGGATITITDGAYDNADLTQDTTMKKAFASAVATNAVAGMISLS